MPSDKALKRIIPNDFEKAVKETHGNNNHGKDYKMLCKLIKQKFEV